jgi:lysophospholipase L1-like esterase
MRHRLNALAAWPLLPLVALQGVSLRRNTPRLPDAAGPDTGLLPEGAGKPLDLIVLGESTVAGVGAETHEKALTGQVALHLHEQTGRPVRWRAVGLSGASAARACEHLTPRLAGLRADAVVVALGVNDAISLHTAARWRRDLTRLLAETRRHLGFTPIILAGVPPMRYFYAFPQPLRHFLGARAGLLSHTAAALAAQHERVCYAPFPRPPRPEEFAADGFHPGPLAYEFWGRLLGEATARLLREAQAKGPDKSPGP